MIQHVRLKWLIAILVLALPAAAAQAATIQTVPVGNSGNADDSTGYGAVAYDYNIGKYEVTAGQYRDFLNAVDPTGGNSLGLYNSNMNISSSGCQITWNSAASTYDFSGGTVEVPGSTASDWEDRPVGDVSFWDAARFANWLQSGDTESGAYHDIGDPSLFGRNAGALWFIPTKDEWYKAAYYDGDTGNYFDYPTSSNSAPGYVNNSGNLSGTGAAFIEGGIDPGNYATYDGDGGTNGIGSPYYRTEAGEWENSESPYGTFDQGGNVWEWNEAITGNARGLRGGSFSSAGSDLQGWYGNGADPTYEYRISGSESQVSLSPVASRCWLVWP